MLCCDYAHYPLFYSLLQSTEDSEPMRCIIHIIVWGVPNTSSFNGATKSIRLWDFNHLVKGPLTTNIHEKGFIQPKLENDCLTIIHTSGSTPSSTPTAVIWTDKIINQICAEKLGRCTFKNYFLSRYLPISHIRFSAGGACFYKENVLKGSG